MSSDILSIFVIIGISAVASLIYFLYSQSQKRKHAVLYSPKKFEEWMAAHDFAPDQLSFFHGTGIALKAADDRMALYRDGAGQFHALADMITITSRRTIEAVRPLGAAPGVVEQRDILRFHLDITFHHANAPVAIFLANPEQMQAWESRLRERL